MSKLMQDLGSYLGNKNKDLVNNLVSASGFTTKVNPKDRFQETDTPNVLIDKISDDYVIDGVLYSQLGEELVDTSTRSITSTTLVDTAGDDIIGTALLFTVKIKNIVSGVPRFYSSGCTDTSGNNMPSSGTYTFTRIVASDNVQAVLYFEGGGTGKYEAELSVKELKTATKPLALFDPNGTDELLDDKVHGLVCQQAHSKGSFIVTGNELVVGDSSTFENGIGDWEIIANGQVSHNNIDKRLTINSLSTAYGGGRLLISNMVIGAEYNISFEAFNTSGNLKVGVAGQTLAWDGNGIKSFKFTASSQSEYLSVNANNSTNTSTEISNFRIKLKDNIHQATRPTSEMYDYEIPNSYLALNLSVNDVVYNYNGNNTNGIENHYYKCIKGISGNIQTLNLASSEFWLDLGTAENMDLRNPYFQVLEDVTTHDILAMSQTGYKSYRGIKHYLDQELIDGGFDMVASDRGWVKIGNNTYLDEDNEKVFFVSMLGSSLNAGAYHFTFNQFGTKSSKLTNSDGDGFWNSTGSSLDSIFICFVNRNYGENLSGAYSSSGFIGDTGNQGRPDKRLYDKFYTEAENGLLGLGYSHCFDNIDLEIDKNVLKDYIQSGIKTVWVTDNFYVRASDSPNVTISNIDNYTSVPSGTLTCKIGSKVFKIDITSNIVSDLDFYNEVLTLGSSYTWRQPPFSYASITEKSRTHLTGGSKLSIDLIGDPANYPTWLKTSLASGRGVHLNPLLIGQDGTSYIPNGNTYSFNPIYSYKLKTTHKHLRDTGSGFVEIPWQTDKINNTMDDTTNWQPVGSLMVMPYTSYNEPQETVPKEVLKVLDKVFASNSHSIYKDNLIANAISEGVVTSNGSNDYESKSLDNILVNHSNHYDKTFTYPGTYSVSQDETVRFLNYKLSLDSFTYHSGSVFRRKTGGFSNADLPQDLSLNPLDWEYVGGGIIGIPQHQVLTLNNVDSKAAKWFYSLSIKDNQYSIDIYGKELVYNGVDGFNDNGQFDDLSKCLSIPTGVYK